MLDHIRSFHRPTSIREAIRLLTGEKGEACLVAGGTDLALRAGRSVRVLVDISRLGLSYVKRKDGGLRIGATTTMATLEESVLVRLLANGILAKAAASCGSLQTRNMATIGGNLANASPAADTATPLLAMDAEVVLQGLRSSRRLPLERFFAGAHATISNRELLLEIVVPPCKSNSAFSFQRLARTEVDIAVVNVAAAVRWDARQRCSGVRLALGAVAPCPMRSRRAEALLEGQIATEKVVSRAAEIASEDIAPISDVRASAEYRREITRVLVRRAFQECSQRLEHERSIRVADTNGGS
ncbi:MAG TPA: xanthine dehydrogenase family protein subunit M [Terriglobales bacterium]|nr:xanthine dehydrogenase family protein subunit M [Terriglobales bacterium]